MKTRRERRIERIRQRLLRKSLPRLVMTVIVSLTGVSAFLASVMLLWTGVLKMWIRYPAAVVLAYLVFLILLGAWLWLQRRSLDPDGLDVLELIPSDAAHEHNVGEAETPVGAADQSTWINDLPKAVSSEGSSALESMSPDWDDALPILLAIALIVVGLCASLYVIYIAPALLAEILVDGALIAGLYSRVKRIEQRHWLRAAVRRTVLPALGAAVLFGVAGYLLQSAAPDAHTLGEVWEYSRH